MKRTPAVIVIAMVLCAALTASAVAQRNETRRYALMVMQDTQYRDLMLLMRLAPMQLSAGQIDGILQVLDAKMPGPDAQTQAELDDLRQRLLRGEQMTASDRKIVREGLQGWMDEGAARQMREAAEMIHALLTPQQAAMLTGRWGRRAADAPEKHAAATMLRALAELVKIGDDAKRTEQAAKIVDAVTQNVDPAMTDTQVQDLDDFIQRVSAMSETQFGAQREELQAELEIILPEGFDPASFETALNPEAVQRQIIQTFMTGAAREVLQKMQQARSEAPQP